MIEDIGKVKILNCGARQMLGTGLEKMKVQEEMIGGYNWKLEYHFEDRLRPNEKVVRLLCVPRRYLTDVNWVCKAQVSIQFIDENLNILAKKTFFGTFNEFSNSFMKIDMSSRLPFNLVANVIVMSQKTSRRPTQTKHFHVERRTDDEREVVFMIDKIRLFGNRDILAFHSSVLAMLMSQPNLGTFGHPIVINNGHKFEDIRTMFRLILTTTELISKRNCEKQLELAACYDVPLVFNRCEEFLTNRRADMNPVERFLLAEKFKLFDLERVVLNSINEMSKAQVVAILRDRKIKEVSETNQLRVHRRLMDLEELERAFGRTRQRERGRAHQHARAIDQYGFNPMNNNNRVLQAEDSVEDEW